MVFSHKTKVSRNYMHVLSQVIYVSPLSTTNWQQSKPGLIELFPQTTLGWSSTRTFKIVCHSKEELLPKELIYKSIFKYIQTSVNSWITDRFLNQALGNTWVLLQDPLHWAPFVIIKRRTCWVVSGQRTRWMLISSLLRKL